MTSDVLLPSTLLPPSSLRVRCWRGCGHFYFPPALSRNKGTEDRGSWWPLRGRCVSSPVASQRGGGLSAPRGGKRRARRQSGSQALQPGVQPGCQARRPPRGQCERRPAPSLAGAAGAAAQEDPRREARGRTDTGGRATGRKGNCEPPQGPNTERRDRLSPCQHGRLPKRLILSSGLFTITKERHVDFWFSGEMFWMMGLKKKKDNMSFIKLLTGK